MILAQAGRFGGWSLYLKDGKPTYTYNFLGLQRFTIAATKAVPAGKATIRFEFAYDGGGLGKGGMGTIFVNGKKVAEGRIERTQPMIFSADEGADVGEDGETPVVEDYGIPAPYKFTGKIAKVTIELKEMKAADKAEADKPRAEAAHEEGAVGLMSQPADRLRPGTRRGVGVRIEMAEDGLRRMERGSICNMAASSDRCRRGYRMGSWGSKATSRPLFPMTTRPNCRKLMLGARSTLVE